MTLLGSTSDESHHNETPPRRLLLKACMPFQWHMQLDQTMNRIVGFFLGGSERE